MQKLISAINLENIINAKINVCKIFEVYFANK